LKGYSFFQKNYGVIIFVTAGILIIPQLYYLSNVEEFSYDALMLSIPLALSLILLLLGIIFPLGERCQLFLAGVGLSILLCDQFLRPDINHLDGASRDIPIDPFFTSINALLYFGLPLVLLIFGEKFKKLLTEVSFILFFLAISTTIYSISSSVLLSPFANKNTVEHDKGKFAIKTDKQLPNIYFIWLDAMETGSMKKYLSDPSIHGSFTGFTLFENNSANYLYSLQSYPSFMSGTVFREGSYEEWIKRGDDLRGNLDSIGYRITTYAKKDFLSPLDDVSYSSEDIHFKWANAEHPFVTDFVAYWVVRSLPSFYANQSLVIGKKLGGLMHSWFNPYAKYLRVKSISDGVWPLRGVFTLKQLIADEEYRVDNNEFVIAHAVIPHSPYVIDKRCDYRGQSSEGPFKAYYEQVVCSSNLVKDFLGKLRDLNRYDSSLIIIMGDHGSGWAGLIEGFKDGEKPLNNKYMSWSKSMVISRASALLMVKPPKTSNTTDLSISSKESQLVDIYPTIFSLIGYPQRIATDVDGIDLFGGVNYDREKYITYFKPGNTLNPYDAEVYDLKYESPRGLVDILYRSRFKEESDLPTIKCNQILVFSGAEYYIATGLSGFERRGRWSDDKIVRFKFKLPKNGCKDSKVIFSLRGFVTKKNLVQSSKVVFNNEKIGEININLGEQNPRDFEFSIPSELIKPGEVNVLEFHIDKPVSPKSVGVNNDSRLLGLFFYTMVFQ